MSDIVLQCVGLHKSFGGVVAVDDMSLSVERGKITGLIGPNGAGKSTLFNLIAGVYKNEKGSIKLFGKTVDKLRPWQIARLGVARTFQLSRELSRMTVLENLMLAPKMQLGENFFSNFMYPEKIKKQEKENYDQANLILEKVKLSQVRDHYSSDLSGGQKKLLELARALMIDPELILLDETGAGVNPVLMDLLLETIKDLNVKTGKTFLVVEHDMELISKLCHHVVVMAEGSFLTEGRFEQVTHDPKVMEAYLGNSDA